MVAEFRAIDVVAVAGRREQHGFSGESGNVIGRFLRSSGRIAGNQRFDGGIPRLRAHDLWYNRGTLLFYTRFKISPAEANVLEVTGPLLNSYSGTFQRNSYSGLVTAEQLPKVLPRLSLSPLVGYPP